METKAKRVRCGICGVVNDLDAEREAQPGELFECGWCCGLTVVAVRGDHMAVTRRRGALETTGGCYTLIGMADHRHALRRDAGRFQGGLISPSS